MSAAAVNHAASAAAPAAVAADGAAAAAAARPRRVVTFVTGSANKLKETQQCFGDSIILKSKAVDCQWRGKKIH